MTLLGVATETVVTTTGRLRVSKVENALKAARAYDRRVELLYVLAPDGRCAICRKKPHNIDKLHIDHIDGRTWSLHKVNRWARVGRYWREHRAGARLRALCITCNNKHRPPGHARVPHPKKKKAR